MPFAIFLEPSYGRPAKLAGGRRADGSGKGDEALRFRLPSVQSVATLTTLDTQNRAPTAANLHLLVTTLRETIFQSLDRPFDMATARVELPSQCVSFLRIVVVGELARGARKGA